MGGTRLKFSVKSMLLVTAFSAFQLALHIHLFTTWRSQNTFLMVFLMLFWVLCIGTIAAALFSPQESGSLAVRRNPVFRWVWRLAMLSFLTAVILGIRIWITA